jgi:GDP-4-dehydro-6-deoxy-D-mannose reductase
VKASGNRVLVTGARGFAGSHLTSLLRGLGHDVWETDVTAGEPSARATVFDETRLLLGDLTDLEFLEKTISELKPEVIFHLAARTGSLPRGAGRGSLLGVNVAGTQKLLDVVARAQSGTRILVTSSSSVYGAPPSEDQPIAESTEPGPRSLYAASKLCQEIVALTYYRSHGVPVVITRAFNHTGPGERQQFATSSFARQIAEIEARVREPKLRVGNLEAFRDFSDVRDVVRGYAEAAFNGRAGECYNMCSGMARRMADVLESLRRICGCDFEVEVDPDRLQVSDVPYQCGSLAKTERDLGWTPQIPFEQTLSDLLNYWRDRVKLESGK